MTITNVIIKTPDSKRDWGVNDVMAGSDGLLRFDSGPGSPAEALAVGDVGTVSIVKIVSLSLSLLVSKT